MILHSIKDIKIQSSNLEKWRFSDNVLYLNIFWHDTQYSPIDANKVAQQATCTSNTRETTDTISLSCALHSCEMTNFRKAGAEERSRTRTQTDKVTAIRLWFYDAI